MYARRKDMLTVTFARYYVPSTGIRKLGKGRYAFDLPFRFSIIIELWGRG